MPDVIRRLCRGAERIVRSRMGQLTCLQEQAHSKAGVCPEQFGSACLLYNSNSVGTKGETMLSPRILRGLIFILWLVLDGAVSDDVVASPSTPQAPRKLANQ